MSKSIKQLREELEILQTNVSTLATELGESYGKYLANLTDSVPKQLILACYQICTQKYPAQFLKLSFNERHNIQQEIKSLKLIFEEKLADYLLNIDYLDEDLIQNFQKIILKNQTEIDEIDEDKDDETESKNNQKELTPDSLIKLHLQIDHSIHDTLKDISQIANRRLQKQSILPPQLPPKILDLALQAEENNPIMSGVPNLLSLLIEKEQDQEEEDRNITPIVAICLRLLEIEFADPNLAFQKNQIRNILAKIEKIRGQYDQKQQQYLSAEAEAAWRSSWFDEQ